VFQVSRDETTDGKFIAADRKIIISQKAHHRLESMLRTMAHEMVHLYIWRKGSKDRAEHGAEFKKLARLVCKHHGFEEATF
jgi:predicted SprT family Zn-dependent metalloprotease